VGNGRCPDADSALGEGPIRGRRAGAWIRASDRDQTVGLVKPFRDLAWGLASQGIAVFALQKRTKQYASRFTRPCVIS